MYIWWKLEITKKLLFFVCIEIPDTKRKIKANCKQFREAKNNFDEQQFIDTCLLSLLDSCFADGLLKVDIQHWEKDYFPTNCLLCIQKQINSKCSIPSHDSSHSLLLTLHEWKKNFNYKLNFNIIDNSSLFYISILYTLFPPLFP